MLRSSINIQTAEQGVPAGLDAKSGALPDRLARRHLADKEVAIY